MEKRTRVIAERIRYICCIVVVKTLFPYKLIMLYADVLYMFGNFFEEGISSVMSTKRDRMNSCDITTIYLQIRYCTVSM